MKLTLDTGGGHIPTGHAPVLPVEPPVKPLKPEDLENTED
jgi:hypothetical protein